MTTNNPEVVGFATHHDDPMLLPTLKEAAAYCGDGEEPIALIRLSDYERLQSEREALVDALTTARETIAYVLRANAPDYFTTDADIARHVDIQRIDAALAAQSKQGGQ